MKTEKDEIAERYFGSTPFQRRSYLTIPFGTYSGEFLRNIPLQFLDEKISVMPPRWLIRQVQLFVEEAMTLAGAYVTEVPKETWNQLRAQFPEIEVSRLKKLSGDTPNDADSLPEPPEKEPTSPGG